jgi:hypothetical protein
MGILRSKGSSDTSAFSATSTKSASNAPKIDVEVILMDYNPRKNMVL